MPPLFTLGNLVYGAFAYTEHGSYVLESYFIINHHLNAIHIMLVELRLVVGATLWHNSMVEPAAVVCILHVLALCAYV